MAAIDFSQIREFSDIARDNTVTEANINPTDLLILQQLQNNRDGALPIDELKKYIGREAGVDSHVSDKSNPHDTTKAQVGLGNVVNRPMDSSPTENSENYVKSGGVYSAIKAETERATQAESNEASAREAADNTLQANINSEATARESADNTLQANINSEATARENVDNELGGAIATEARLRGDADTALENQFASDIETEATARENADNELQENIDAINAKIPPQTTAQNQLADKNFVNSSIQTNTAYFRGEYDAWADVPASAEGYPIDSNGNRSPTNNDYMTIIDASGFGNGSKTGTWRFKYTGVWSEQGMSGWQPEYKVNATPLTAAQLAALNSNITAEKVAEIETKNSLITVENGGNDENGAYIWRSNAQGVDDGDASLTLIPRQSLTINFDWRVSSEEGYDFFRIWYDDDTLVEENGESDGHFTRHISDGYAFILQYAKDGNSNEGDDCAEISNMTVTLDDDNAVVRITPANINHFFIVDEDAYTFVPVQILPAQSFDDSDTLTNLPAGPNPTTARRFPLARLWNWILGHLTTNFYGATASPSSAQVKVISIPGFQLREGVHLFLKFANGHTLLAEKNSDNAVTGNNLKFSINGSRAIDVRIGGELAGENCVRSGEMHEYIYDGTDLHDLTATVIYMGTDENGDYAKNTDGKFERDIRKTNNVWGGQNIFMGDNFVRNFTFLQNETNLFDWIDQQYEMGRCGIFNVYVSEPTYQDAPDTYSVNLVMIEHNGIKTVLSFGWYTGPTIKYRYALNHRDWKPWKTISAY